MKSKLTLLQTVECLEREDVVKYATNLGVELNEEWSTSQMRKAYADYVLTHPKEVLSMLPFMDIQILTPSELERSSTSRSLFNAHVTPIFVKYGLAEMEEISSTDIEIIIPDDFFQAVAPYLDWVMADEENKGLLEAELMVEGLTNLFGIVTQQDIKKYLIKLCEDKITDEQAEEGIAYLRQRSLLLDSMEWREHGDETKEEDVLFVSRYGWEDRDAMKLFIEERAEKILSPREFTISEVVDAALPLNGLMPNEKCAEFRDYLAHDLRLEKAVCNLICFKVWYCKMLKGLDDSADQLMESYFLSFGIIRSELDLSEQQLEEAMQRLTDYTNHIPLWHLRGFTATDYPSEAYVPMRKAKFKGPLGKELKKLKQNMLLMVDLMDGKIPKPLSTKQPVNRTAEHLSLTDTNPRANQKIGRNDPCPCGSGKKYKKCCGRGL